MKNKDLDIHIQRYLDGDSYEFDYIYEETKKYVYLSIYTYIKNQMIIEDLMQDTYMKALENLESYKIGTNFYAWISIIARNLAINCYNKNKREDIVEENIATENPNNDSLITYSLSILTGLEKDIFIYHIVLNMKFNDISKIVNKPLATVYSIYKKAIKNIKKKL